MSMSALALSQIDGLNVSGIYSPAVSNADSKVRVLVVDGYPLFREGVAAVLERESDLSIVGEASDGLEAIEQYRALQPDVAVMDLQMPVMNGIDALRAIRTQSPTARIVLLTTLTGDAPALRALKAGASAYVLKERVRTDLADIIRAAHRGMKRIEPAIAQQIVNHVSDGTLTSRQVEILQLVSGGDSNKAIARKLTISLETAKCHVKRIIEKLGARDRTHAVTLGLRRGIIQL